MTHIDSAGLQALEDLAGTLKSDGIAMHFARAKSRRQTASSNVSAVRASTARFRAALDTATRDQAGVPVP